MIAPANSMPSAESNGTKDLMPGPFSGRETFRQYVRDILSTAASAQWPVIVLSDPDFADWPLAEKAVVQSLSDWSKSGRSLILLASRFDLVQAHHARFVGWRQRWDHIVTCRRFGSKNEASGVPSLIWTPDWILHRTETENCVGVCTQSAQRKAELREIVDNCLKQSSPGFAASVLGL